MRIKEMLKVEYIQNTNKNNNKNITPVVYKGKVRTWSEADIEKRVAQIYAESYTTLGSSIVKRIKDIANIISANRKVDTTSNTFNTGLNVVA